MGRPTVDEIVSAAREFVEADDRVAELGWTRETEEAFDAAKARLAELVAEHEKENGR